MAGNSKSRKTSSSRRSKRSGKGFGWIPDLPDHRDFLYAAPVAMLRALPTRVDLRRQCPPIYDQGQLGSCTANAIGGAIEFDQMKQGLSQIFLPSRLFIYYNERVLEGTTNSDSGAMIRDGIKTVANQGACPEPMWPYIITKFRLLPKTTYYTDAAKNTAVTYKHQVHSVSQIHSCLSTD